MLYLFTISAGPSDDLKSRPHYRNISDIQLNFGCPSRSVIKDGGGPAMLKRKQKLTDIFLALRDWRANNMSGSLNIESIGIKIRLGLNASEMSSKVYLNVVDIANKAGLDYIVVHGRHGGQRSSDRSDWAAIREIKDIANMSVIGNGDLMSYADALRMMHDTQCDGVMIARGAMRNPWIFKQLRQINTDPSPIIGNNYGRDMKVDEYWPCMDELTDVESMYFAWIAQHPPTNRKCLNFHTENFNRIRLCIQRQNFTEKWLNPSKV